MHNVFWILPGQLAGRPGPDEEPWEIPALHQAGIRAVLSVNDGRQCDPVEFARAGIAYACHPLSDWVPPQPGDLEFCLEVLPRAHDFVLEHLKQAHPVLVHCSGGNDRTGLCLSYCLHKHLGLSSQQAIQRVRSVRPTALSAVGWEEFAEQVLKQV